MPRPLQALAYVTLTMLVLVLGYWLAREVYRDTRPPKPEPLSAEKKAAIRRLKDQGILPPDYGLEKDQRNR